MGLSQRHKIKALINVTLGGLAAYGVIGFVNNDQKLYKNVFMPVIHLLDGENAHKLAVFANKYRLLPKSKYEDPSYLNVNLFGKVLKNPVGIAAGFDKNGEAILGLSDLGFGFIEIGSVTPVPQPGNDKPRVFRLSEDKAVINRYGFNNEGHEVVYNRICRIRENDNFNGIIGVNLGKNKNSENAIEDYVAGIKKFGPVADYLVINVSSPNTPGLRDLQTKKHLTDLLTAALAARNSLPGPNKPPLLLKLAPDLTKEERADIANVISYRKCHVDGLICSNTTIERPIFLSNKREAHEVGGLSGKPLREKSTQLIEEMYRLTKGQVPIVGVGGVGSGRDAYEKIKAGASVVQIYTSLVYEGPPVVTKIKKELAQLLQADGYTNISQAVGKSVKK